MNWIEANPDQAAGFASKFTGLDKKTASEALKRIRFHPQPQEKAVAEFARFLDEMDYVKIRQPAAFASNFIDASFLNSQ